jgi:hypothetical protein
MFLGLQWVQKKQVIDVKPCMFAQIRYVQQLMGHNNVQERDARFAVKDSATTKYAAHRFPISS